MHEFWCDYVKPGNIQKQQNPVTWIERVLNSI